MITWIITIHISITYFFSTADSTDKTVINQNGFYVAPGSETLVAITPTILNTTTSAISKFSPEKRNCYTPDEFDFKYFKRERGFRYSMYNCLYESLLENVFSNCSCIPNFASIKFPELPDDFHVCTGNELHCAVKMGNEMGNEDFGLVNHQWVYFFNWSRNSI